MQSTREAISEPKTYHEAKQNVDNHFHSLGFELDEKIIKHYQSFQHPLEVIIHQLGDAKVKYAMLSLADESGSKMLTFLKHAVITNLRHIVQDGLSYLTVDELLQVTFDTGRPRRTPLLAFLGELGEFSLFKAAFIKLHLELTEETLQRTLAILLHAYEGSRVSEPLGLASSILGRGNPCYIDIANWLLGNLHKQGKAIELIAQFASEKDISMRSSVEVKDSLEEYLNIKWQYASHEELVTLDETKVKRQATAQYSLFVTQQQQEHLFWKLITDYTNSPALLESCADKLGSLLNKNGIFAASDLKNADKNQQEMAFLIGVDTPI